MRAGWRFLVAILIFVAANIAASLAAFFTSPHSYTREFVFRGVATALLLAGYWWMTLGLDGEYRRPMAYLGLDADRAWIRQTLVGFAYGAVLVSLAVLVMALWGGITFSLRLSALTVGMAVAQLLIFAIAAMLEELAFRGYPFHRLIEAVGPVGAIVIANVLFGAVHMGNPDVSGFALGNTFLVGVPFAIAYLCTKALWLPWGFHWGWNFTLGVIYGLKVSGGDFSGPVRGTPTGPDWLTGGRYGIEAGASGTAAILVGLAGIFWLCRQPALMGVVPRASLSMASDEKRGIQQF